MEATISGCGLPKNRGPSCRGPQYKDYIRIFWGSYQDLLSMDTTLKILRATQPVLEEASRRWQERSRIWGKG